MIQDKLEWISTLDVQAPIENTVAVPEAFNDRTSLRVLLRADAGPDRGTGHVMRCLTLAEALRSRGHRPELATNEHNVSWLWRTIADSGVPVTLTTPDTLDTELVGAYDWMVVDSYTIEAEAISGTASHTKTLAIVDGDDRGIRAAMFLDQNLGADEKSWPEHVQARILAGPSYSLIRDAVLAERSTQPWRFRHDPPLIVAFMGGTDPLEAARHLVDSLTSLTIPVEIVVVTAVEFPTDDPRVSLLQPTPDLPRILGNADVVVSAAGTSAWDVCALGVPPLLIALVENQRASLRAVTGLGLSLGIDAINDIQEIEQSSMLVQRLLTDENLRRELSESGTNTFDGLGKYRVVDAMERMGCVK